MIEIRTLVLGQMQTNCYLVFDGTERDAVIIDPGDDADYIERVISDLALRPKLILATHGHFDHVLAVAELKMAYRVPFAISEKDKFFLLRMRQTATHFGYKPAVLKLKIDTDLSKIKAVSTEGVQLRVIPTPGHTPGSVSFYIPEAKAVFDGDTLFENNMTGRTDFSYSDETMLKMSAKKLKKLPKDTTFYPGHGDKFTLY